MHTSGRKLTFNFLTIYLIYINILLYFNLIKVNLNSYKHLFNNNSVEVMHSTVMAAPIGWNVYCMYFLVI